ncbi:hypothetical protein ACFL2J_00105 [Candidatus Omnitrophota bacterium]
MNKKQLLIPILILSLLTCSAYSEDESVKMLEVAPELILQEKDFTYQAYKDAIERLQQILDWYYKGQEVGWEYANIGAPNSLLTLKGYGLITQRNIIRLKLEKANEEEVETLKKELADIEEQISDFVSLNIWVD